MRTATNNVNGEKEMALHFGVTDVSCILYLSVPTSRARIEDGIPLVEKNYKKHPLCKTTIPPYHPLWIINFVYVRYVCLYVCMYVCMHVCTKSFLKTTTNSSCVCSHLANKADSDSDLHYVYLI